MAEVEFADAPGLVGGRPGDGQALLHGAGMDGVDFLRTVDPPAHPGPAAPAVAGRARRVGPARALCVKAEEDLGLVRTDAAEADDRIAVVLPEEARPPAELAEPVHAGLDIRDVEDRRNRMDRHERLPARRRNASTGSRQRGLRRADRGRDEAAAEDRASVG